MIGLHKEHGNAMLETVLFTPLVLLLLFGGMDIGLVYSEKAAITDAIRAGARAQMLFSAHAQRVLESDAFLSSLEDLVSEDLLSLVAEEIEQNVRRVQQYSEGEESSSFQVRVASVFADIDPQTGIPELNWEDNLRISRVVSVGTFDMKAEVPCFSIVPLRDFVIKTIRDSEAIAAETIDPSVYAVPVGNQFRKAQYLDEAVLLYTEVRALPRGLAPAITHSFIGHAYALQEQQLHLLRVPLQ